MAEENATDVSSPAIGKYNMRKRRRDPSPVVNEEANEKIAEVAMELFSKRTPRKEKPTIDQVNFDNLFKKRRTSFKDLIRTPAIYKELHNRELPTEHPMKIFFDQNDQGMSVKEALAKGFTNYKVRLPKQRRVIIQPRVVPPGDRPSTLSAALAKMAEINDMPSSPTVSMDFVNNTMMKTEGEDSSSLDNGEEREQSSIARLLDRIRDTSQSPSMLHVKEYPLPPFWKINSDIFRGYKGGYFVAGVKYTQLTTLIHNSAIIVPAKEPIPFLINGTEYQFSLTQLLAANGIIVRDSTNVGDLQAVFGVCGMLIHHRIANYLLNTFGPLSSLKTINLNIEHPPINLSLESPPFACFRMNLFIPYMGKIQGPNEILDESFGLPMPTGNQNLEKEIPARDQLLIAVNSENGTSVAEIAVRFGISEKDVEEVLARRDEIFGRSARVLMDDDKDNDIDEMNRMNRRKSRVRRTTFVGLNVLMWKFFKECADRGISLNGKTLKEQAMLIARQLGLENFKGSEGWLDAFKRRHKIDLKTMSGAPANYEDEEGEIPEQVEANEYNETSMEDDGKPFPGYSEEGEGQPTAVASIENTRPLDLEDWLGLNNLGSSNGEVDVSGNTMGLDEKGFIAGIVKSAAIRVHDKEVAFAIDTLRSYILDKDLGSLPLLVELQQRLSLVQPTSTHKDNE